MTEPSAPQDHDLHWQSIAPEARTLWIIGATLVIVVLAGLGAALFLLLDGPVGAAAVVLGGVVVWLVARVMIGRRWRAWGYAERSADLLIRRGVLVQRLTVVPYGRMQFVDVTQGPLDRRLGVSTVRLHTAAAATDATIPLLRTAEANRLRDRLVILGDVRASGL